MKILGLKSKRLNRGSYILTILVSALLFVAIGLAFGAIFNALLDPIDPAAPDSPHPVGFIPFLVLWFIYFTACTARRFHDMNTSGWASLAIFVPFVGFILGVLLIFVSGTDGVNRYGEPLKGVKIMGFGR